VNEYSLLLLFYSHDKVLAPAGLTPDFPETALLPNEHEIQKQELKIKARLAKENIPIVTIKPSKLNMSRVAVTHSGEDIVIGGVLRQSNAQLQEKSQESVAHLNGGGAQARQKYRKFTWYV
jgi:hypothetical protein